MSQPEQRDEVEMLATMLLAVALQELFLVARSQHTFITETRGVAWWWLVWIVAPNPSVAAG